MNTDETLIFIPPLSLNPNLTLNHNPLNQIRITIKSKIRIKSYLFIWPSAFEKRRTRVLEKFFSTPAIIISDEPEIFFIHDQTFHRARRIRRAIRQIVLLLHCVKTVFGQDLMFLHINFYDHTVLA